LTKHHGLGNDFLVVLDPAGDAAVDAAVARRLCDRRTGVGADGLLLARPAADGTGAVARMTLWNADGSPAEMSGNGIRCLAQALVDGGWTGEGEVRIDTDAGPRTVDVGPETSPGRRQIRVDMGAPAGTLDGDRRASVSMGNPHTVLLVDSLDELPHEDGSRNVEFVVAGPEADAITMRVVERGVGETLACGTGAAAAAWAAHRWGLVGTSVTVHQRGGDAVVELKDETALLTGPAVRIAAVEVP
jgi:diaminopimelate epimerase